MAAKAFAADAFGYLLKNSTEQDFIEAIRRIGLGNRVLSSRIANGDWQALAAKPREEHNPLSRRKRDVVRRVARGLRCRG